MTLRCFCRLQKSQRHCEFAINIRDNACFSGLKPCIIKTTKTPNKGCGTKTPGGPWLLIVISPLCSTKETRSFVEEPCARYTSPFHKSFVRFQRPRKGEQRQEWRLRIQLLSTVEYACTRRPV